MAVYDEYLIMERCEELLKLKKKIADLDRVLTEEEKEMKELNMKHQEELTEDLAKAQQDKEAIDSIVKKINAEMSIIAYEKKLGLN